MDQLSLDRIKTAHPKVRAELLQLYTKANNQLGKNVRLRLAYVYRSVAEQDALFKLVPKVTNAKGWQSIHNYGLAFDIVLLIDKDNNGTFESASWDTIKDFDGDKISDWLEVVKVFKDAGWEWGGDFKSIYDAPHFELKKSDGTSYKWQDLKKQIELNKVIIDNNIKYPII